MKNSKKFENLIQKMDIEELRKMALGMQMFTKLCIDNKFKYQRNAIIDFALIAKYTYFERKLKEIKNNKDLPY